MSIFPGLAYILVHRSCQYLRDVNKIWRPLYLLFRLLRRHLGFRFGIQLPMDAKIGDGFRIDHFGGIFLSGGIEIGRMCSISHGVVCGYLPRGPHQGTPIAIGDRVWIGPGAKLLGRIRVGSDVVIGANSVVVKDVPDYATVFGVPARLVSLDGSHDYINPVTGIP